MPNDSVFDPKNQPVFTRVTNTFHTPGTIAPPETGAGKSGSLFISTATNSQNLNLLGGTVTISLQVSNPGGSGKTVYVSSFSGGTGISLSLLSSFSATATLVRGGTLTSPSAVAKTNTNFTSSNTSVMNVNSSTAAVTGGTPFLTLPLVAGQFSIEETGRIVVPPGQSIAMTVSASLSVAGILSSIANITWWEV
ncbi:hypothetical protein DVH26_00820 [Paenibacillus sp. H1-7]|uniref:hypothetical protein n=1 Tax=Paenibacillus sp. H1-7 TaxID=2282849 RepID=UPI001EF8D0A8|nr:hypothetical protein [Paenibacillus sp. H1-7]ULL13146.1 hypothetical protein DVH26_00820 [Paenibacillus sp. H1-7]